MSGPLPNPLPRLTPETEADLSASIERRGVILPAVHDQHGRTLDGRNRERLAGQLGVELPPPITVEVRDDGHARELALDLNLARRHLSVGDRRDLVGGLRAEGKSERAIADELGVPKTTVHRDLQASGGPGGPPAPETVAGQDGKSYPAKRKRRPRPVRVPADKAELYGVAQDLSRAIARGNLDRARRLAVQVCLGLGVSVIESQETSEYHRDAATKLARDLGVDRETVNRDRRAANAAPAPARPSTQAKSEADGGANAAPAGTPRADRLERDNRAEQKRNARDEREAKVVGVPEWSDDELQALIDSADGEP
jgi:hypothetical protein